MISIFAFPDKKNKHDEEVCSCLGQGLYVSILQSKVIVKAAPKQIIAVLYVIDFLSKLVFTVENI